MEGKYTIDYVHIFFSFIATSTYMQNCNSILKTVTEEKCILLEIY